MLARYAFLLMASACVLFGASSSAKAQTPTNVQVKALMQGLWDGSVHKPSPVSVELRSGGVAPTASVLVARATGMLSSTGTVTVTFNNLSTGNYWIIIRHGGSLPISSAAQQSITSGSTFTYDFSDAAAKTYGGGTVVVNIGGTNYYVLKAGDFTGDRAANPLDISVFLNGYSKTNAITIPPID